MKPWLREHLVCPADRMPLREDGNWLISQAGRGYPVVNRLYVETTRSGA